MSRFLEYFEVERLRKILKGEIKFKKCPDCDEDGLEYCNDGGDTYPHPLEEWVMIMIAVNVGIVGELDFCSMMSKTT